MGKAYSAGKRLATQATPLIATMFGEVTAMIDQQETPEASRERKRIFKMLADVRGNLAAAGSKLRLHHEAAYPTISGRGLALPGPPVR